MGDFLAIAVSLHFNCIPMHLGSNLCFLFSDRLEMTEPGGGDSRKKGAGTLVGNFELNPYRRPTWAWLNLF